MEVEPEGRFVGFLVGLITLRVLQNAYVLTAYGNGLIPPIPRHRQDLTRHALCSRWSNILRDDVRTWGWVSLSSTSQVTQLTIHYWGQPVTETNIKTEKTRRARSAARKEYLKYVRITPRRSKPISLHWLLYDPSHIWMLKTPDSRQCPTTVQTVGSRAIRTMLT
jgi:hypothetical protein